MDDEGCAPEPEQAGVAAVTVERQVCGSPSGGEARRRGGTHVGEAPPLPKTTIFGLTESGLSGRIRLQHQSVPRLCWTCGPPLQAGCFVSRLLPPKTQRKSLCAIGHSAPWHRRRQAHWPERHPERPPAAPLHGGLLPAVPVLTHLFQLRRADRSRRAAHRGTWRLARSKLLTPRRIARPRWFTAGTR